MLSLGLLLATIFLISEVTALEVKDVTPYDDFIPLFNPGMEKATIDGTGSCTFAGGSVTLPAIGDDTLVGRSGLRRSRSCSSTVEGPETSNLEVSCTLLLRFASLFEITAEEPLVRYQCTRSRGCRVQIDGTAPTNEVTFSLTASRSSSRNSFECQVTAVEGPTPTSAITETTPNSAETTPTSTDGPAVLNTCDCGRQSSTKIVGGTLADDNEYPFAVRLSIAATDGNFLCGGTLVSDSFVITAAHCTEGAITITALLGANNPSQSEGQTVTVAEIIDHPDYDASRLQNDVSLLRLDNPVDFASSSRIRPVCLPEGSDTYAGITATAIGWGRTGTGLPGSADLLEVQVPVLSNLACSQSYGTLITDLIICAGVTDSGTCNGDSGGALLNKVSGSYYELIGVTSFGDSTCTRRPGGFGRVTALMSWINAEISSSSTCQTPP